MALNRSSLSLRLLPLQWRSTWSTDCTTLQILHKESSTDLSLKLLWRLSRVQLASVRNLVNIFLILDDRIRVRYAFGLYVSCWQVYR